MNTETDERQQMNLGYPIKDRANGQPRKKKQTSCCLFSVLIRKNQVRDFLNTKNLKFTYSFFYLICLISFVIYFAFVVSLTNTVKKFYDSQLLKTGQIVNEYNSSIEESSLSDLNKCAKFSADEFNSFVDYMDSHSTVIVDTHFILTFISSIICFLLSFPYFPKFEYQGSIEGFQKYLFLFFFYQDKNKNKIHETMEKFYSGILLLLIFTSGSSVGYSPTIFISTQKIGDEIYCLTNHNISTIESLNEFLYIESILLLALYACSLIFLASNCIKIRLFKYLTGLFIAIAGLISIVLSFIIIIQHSSRFVKSFYLITFVSGILLYSILHRQYINEKFKCLSFEDDDDEEEGNKEKVQS